MAEFDQAQLLGYVNEALTALQAQLGHIPTVEQVQAYVREHRGIDVSRERIKAAGDMVLELRYQDLEE